MTDASWVPALIATFQQHYPWIVDKAAGALVAQPIRELWQLVKSKLGPTTSKVEAQPDDTSQWELLKAKLLVALDEDPAFAEKLRGLAERTISQQATGDNNKQAAVSNSTNVKISM